MPVTYRLDYTWKGDKQKRAEWVAMLMPAAEDTATKISISPEAIIAQAALETGWGKKAIGHNLFGVKADASWTGKKQLVATHEVINGVRQKVDDWFRDYDTYEESIADHFTFLDENPRYRKAGVFDGKGDKAYFEAMHKAGYATDPKYADTLVGVLKSVKALTAKMTRVTATADFSDGQVGMCMARPMTLFSTEVQNYLTNRTFSREKAVETFLDMRTNGSTPPLMSRKPRGASGSW